MSFTTSAQKIIAASKETSADEVPDQYWELVEEYRGLLINQAYAMLGNLEDAEDVVQETFCEAVRNPDKLADARSLGALLRSINRANALNRLRDRELALSKKERKQRNLPRRKFTTGGLNALDIRESVTKAIENLDPEWRQVIVLRYWEDLPFQDIAKRMKLPLTTVWRLHLEATMRLYGKLGVDLDAAGEGVEVSQVPDTPSASRRGR